MPHSPVQADIAKLRAAAASEAAVKAAMKAGLTCTVKENCESECDNTNPLDQGAYTCTLKEGENPDGVTTRDGSQTACPDVSVNADGSYRSPNPCELFAAEQQAAAQAAAAKLEGEKTCIEQANCKTA